MKIAVTGHRGRLGSELVRRGCVPVLANVTDFINLGNELRQISPDAVIHCAAYTNVDGCEQAVSVAANTNTGGTFALTQVFPGKLVYISTDYIFDGKFGPYDERANPCPISVYGWSKLGGEITVKNRNNPADLIIRTTILYDSYSPNFATLVYGKLKNGEIIELPNNLYGNPTYIPRLADGILAAIEKDACGILNIAGAECLSRFQFGKLIAKVAELPEKQIVPGPVVGAAPRPLRAGLITKRARALGIPISNPKQDIGAMIYALETMAAG